MPHRATITVARPNPILPDQILDTELDEVSRGLGPRGEARAGQPGGYIARGPPASGQSTPDLHPAHISHPAQPRPPSPCTPSSATGSCSSSGSRTWCPSAAVDPRTPTPPSPHTTPAPAAAAASASPSRTSFARTSAATTTPPPPRGPPCPR